VSADPAPSAAVVTARPDLLVVEPGPERREALLRESLSAFEVVSFPVTGACMTPAVAPGEIVRVAAKSVQDPRFGDIVLVASREGPRLHRLVFSGLGHIRTRGDRALGFDGVRRRGDVLGTVLGVERKGALVPVYSPWRALASLLAGLSKRARLAIGLGA